MVAKWYSQSETERGTVCLLLSFDLTCCLCDTSLLYVYTSLVTKDLVRSHTQCLVYT